MEEQLARLKELAQNGKENTSIPSNEVTYDETSHFSRYSSPHLTETTHDLADRIHIQKESDPEHLPTNHEPASTNRMRERECS